MHAFDHEEVARLAYQFSEERGRPFGWRPRVARQRHKQARVLSVESTSRPNPGVRRMRRPSLRYVAWKSLVAGLYALILGACSSGPIPPASTQPELKVVCERRGGSWHDDGLIGGLCEHQL